SREVAKAVDATRRSHYAAEAANRAKSDAPGRTKLRDAQKYQDEALRRQKKISELEEKLAQAQRRLNEAQQRLARAEAQKAQERNRRLKEQEKDVRKQKRLIASITNKLTRHDRLHDVAFTAIEKLQRLPKEITVLFLAANPLDQEQLRLDEEVRAIGEMIRKAKYRDVVRLESRWALRPLDVLQAINECRPTIVHFSGHGSERD